ncbi:FtsQ-type POTRA domain-containing protein [Microbacterium sp. bgisy207]|uniref:FtsQ-type POTRA domain-containing protein n=1 Tax=Microbacterium sp. bgisy207 TaxID=3413800 RepID=UPI003EBB77F9
MTAPILPLTPDARRTDTPVTDTGATDDSPAQAVPGIGSPPASGNDPGGGSEAVGAREVWRAARARRRALKSEVRRFTARARRRRAVWLGSLAAVVLVALGSVGAAYSPLFAVETITVAGAEQLDAQAVSDALSSQLGTPLPLVDESAIKAALVAFPLVESYTVEARPPHDLIVRVVERTPIGVIASPAGFTLVDAAGVALSTTQTPAAGRPVLEVTGGTASDAFAALGHVLRSLPAEIMLQVTEASATTPNDVTLTLGGTGTQIVWGNADESADKAIALSAAMRSRPPETVSRYDVSSPSAVVIQ